MILGHLVLPTDGASAAGAAILGDTIAETILGPQGPDPDRRPPGIPSGDPRNALGAGLPAAALARALSLGGGSATLDAACASSLYAIAQACADLAEGRIDAALAGGVSRPDALYTQMGFSQLRALSPDGRCHPFDARGNGLVVGEGAGVFLLRRLADAERAGDRIIGVIRGVGLSNDLAGSLLAPETAGQLRALRAAYDGAGWHPSEVDLIECHATGTPVGDATEFGSLRELWGEDGWGWGQCALGSIKANIGHLLTAAGAASLTRALLAIEHQEIPPTANFTSPAARIEPDRSPFRFPTVARPWPRRDRDTPRRAAISAFGFGGINAHLLIEESVEVAHRSVSLHREPAIEVRSNEPVAIVGTASRLGPWQDGACMARLLGDDAPLPAPGPPRWFGVERSDWFRRGEERAVTPRARRVGTVAIPPDRFRIAPSELADCLPQQLLLLETARRAIASAGLDPRPDLGERAAVLVGIALDLASTRFHLRWLAPVWVERWEAELGVELTPETRARYVEELRAAITEPLSAARVMGSLGSIVASRAAREFRAGGPSHTYSSDETSGFRALERAVRGLQRGELDLALVGAVDLGGDARSELSRARIVSTAPDGIAHPFSTLGAGPVLVEGAVALVLERLSDATRAGRRVLAVIEGLGCASGGGVVPPRPSRAAWGRSIERALSDARIDGDRIGLVITGTSGAPEEDAAEAGAWIGARIGRPGRPASLASPAERVGHAGAASSLVSVLAATAALDHRTLPALPGGGRPRDGAERELARRFRRSDVPEPWLNDRRDGPRRVLAGAGGIDGNVAHVVLREGEWASARLEVASPLRGVEGRPGLFVVEGASDAALLRGLDELMTLVPRGDDAPLTTLARRWLGARPLDRGRPRALALVARTAGDLRGRVEEARAALVGKIPIADVERSIRDGATIFASPTPLGHAGSVALLFPGSGNDHAGMGRDLLARFPGVWRPLEATSDRLRSQLPVEALWGDPAHFSPSERERILGHVTVASAAAELLRLAGVRPRAAIGYSLGETAAMFALGIWRDRDGMLERLLESALFTRELAGPCRAAARHWRLPPGEPAPWRSGIVDRTADEVRAALSGRTRVYLQIVNTPNECVVGGHPTDVESLVASLGANFYPVAGVTTVHAPVLGEVEQEYRALHRFPVHPPEGIEVWSPALGEPHALSTESVADSITAQGLRGFDFPLSIETAYARGTRLFVETGPGSSCARMVGAILGARPHRTVSLERAREPIELALARVVATLVAERAEVDPEIVVGEVFEPPIEVSGAVQVESGGEPFSPPAFPQQDRRPRSPRRELPVVSATSAQRVPSAPFAEPLLSPPQMHRLPAVVAVATEAIRNHGQALASIVERQRALIADLGRTVPLGRDAFRTATVELGAPPVAAPPVATAPIPASRPVHPADATAWLPRARCLEFGRGSILTALEDLRFSEVDAYPTRVRLPDEPLMLVDRILSIEAEALSLSHGRVVTEHDVLPGAWYLEANLAPTCIAVESGQADLLLCAYLGVDLRTRGLAVYRLLDAEVTFHRDLPRVGETIRYDIRIEQFFEQGESLLFRFRFDATIDGALVLTMRDGCAGFFTEAALASGRGIVEPRNRPRRPARAPDGWRHPSGLGRVKLDRTQLDALRAGDLAEAFGEAFRKLPLRRPATIPGGRMRLLDRVTNLDPTGGPWGLGRVTAELDIQPDDWFLTCHFVDDPVMPGTLMYECCLHTLRVLLLGLGMVGEEGEVEAHPVIGVPGRLRCRGQVLPTSRVVGYDVSIREIEFGPEPRIIADAKMLVDGREIVEMTGLSVRLVGASRLTALDPDADGHRAGEPRPMHLYDHASILSFALGKPSDAFGDRYLRFDEDFIARLPAPPYCFIDGITEVEGPAWELRDGTRCIAEYTVPPDCFTFDATHQGRMPFSVLLETALQPCGWLAAYCGSALTSDVPLHFRNLGGKAVQHRPVTPTSGLLRTAVTLTSHSASAGMLLEHFSFEITDRDGPIYTGTTYFGFFPRPVLAEQVGIRDAVPEGFPVPDVEGQTPRAVPHHPRLPDARFRMVERIDACDPRGGPAGLGAIRGSIAVDPHAWFFRAHFHQDPVWPGSLGLESLLQLLAVFAIERWGLDDSIELQSVAIDAPHEWTYRGQVLGHRERVTVEAVVTSIDDRRRRITADGRLVVDGLWIYSMRSFTLEAVPTGGSR